MKFSLMILASLMALALFAAADAHPRVVYVGHDKVADALANNKTMIEAPDLLVMGSTRKVNGHSEMHEKQTDVFYIVDGSATFITGGKMVGGELKSPGQWLGAGIEGGEVHHLSKGDVIVIPAGVPHWYKEVPHSVTYFVVKVLK